MQLLGDYDLQFGVLALRLFFVSGDQLVSAINEWEAQDELSLSELLIRSGRISADESQMIEGLLPGQTNIAPANSDRVLTTKSRIRAGSSRCRCRNSERHLWNYPLRRNCSRFQFT